MGTFEEAKYVKEGVNCPDCGAPIKFFRIPNIENELTCECQCVKDKRERERQKLVAHGEKIIREIMHKDCGLRKRLQNISLDAITPASGQQAAFKSVSEFVDCYKNGKTPENGLILSGGVGSGKTLFAAAIANDVINCRSINEKKAFRYGSNSRNVDEVVLSPVNFYSTIELFDRLRAAQFSSGKSESCYDITQKLKNVPLLILDDLGAEKASEFVRVRLFDVLDYRMNENKPLVITTNLTTSELSAQLGDRNADRLRSMCRIVTIREKSKRETA